MTRAHESRGPKAVLSVVAVVAGALAVVALIGVGGDFPLSDDWSYAFATRALCTTGELRLLPWTGAALVLQVWYGAALCGLLGFSFTVLRASTLVLATAGAIGFVLLLRHLGVRGAALAAATALFALNPLYLNLAFTFMTDVPFTAAAVWAAYGYARGLDARRSAWLAWGGLAAAAALLIRQPGIVVAAAAALAALLARDRPRAERVRHALAAAALPVAAFVAFHLWLFGVHGAPLGYQEKLGQARGLQLARAANCAFRGLEYLGLFLCPVALARVPALRARHQRTLAAWGAALVALAVALYLREGALMFYLSNVLYDLGLGALSLRDTLFLDLPPPVHVGAGLGVGLTAVATGAATALATIWTVERGRARAGGAAAFLQLAALLLFAGTLVQAHYYFDRYLLPVVPFALAAVVVARPVPPTRPLALALTALIAVYAVAGTHDYLAWNRARFAALAALAADGVPATAIDGGVEFNAWHLAAGLDRWPSDAEARRGQPASTRSWWWVVDDRMVLSFRPLAGYAVKTTWPFARWLPPGEGRVLVLERVPPS